jgi:RNA polymerase sigma-70 factor (ECF subfamily)
VPQIARAFLSSDITIAQRLVRAKRLLRDAQIDLDLPEDGELAGRVDSVLEVIYLMFTAGYNADTGDDLTQPLLCAEALRLGRLTAASHVAGTPAAHALVALMAFHAARLPARVDEAGELVLLEDQDRRLWDRRLIALGFMHLEKSAEGPRMSAYHAQAAIAAVHVRGEPASPAEWREILGLYDVLVTLDPSPLVALNRAVALSHVAGPGPALAALGAIEDDPALSRYYLLPAMKGQWLAQLGDRTAAIASYEEALARGCSEPEKRFLRRRLAISRTSSDRLTD